MYSCEIFKKIQSNNSNYLQKSKKGSNQKKTDVISTEKCKLLVALERICKCTSVPLLWDSREEVRMQISGEDF